jgi:hypothetical protein
MSKPVRSLKTERMKRAHALIKEKKYAEARDILVTIDNPTARKWVKKIDHILLEEDDPFSDLLPAEPRPDLKPEPQKDVRITQENRPVDLDKAHGQPEVDWAKLHQSREGKSGNTRIWLSSLLGILAIIAVIVLVIVYTRVEETKRQERQEVETAILEFCGTLADKNESECVDYTEIIMRDYDSARNCHASYYPDHRPEMKDCLERIFRAQMAGS